MNIIFIRDWILLLLSRILDSGSVYFFADSDSDPVPDFYCYFFPIQIQQYMLGKAVREAEREERRQRLKKAQEREVARLRALQQRQQEVRDREFIEAVERDQELVSTLF